MEEPLNVRYVFMMLLAIADQGGIVVGTDIAIARRLNVPLNEFTRCVETLSQPDPNSNSQKMEGRRVIQSESERGYLIVNYTVYRGIKDENHRREYMANYMRALRKGKKGNGVARVSKRKQKLTVLAHTEAEAEAERDGVARSLDPVPTTTTPPTEATADPRIPSLHDFCEFYKTQIPDLGPPLAVGDWLMQEHGWHSANDWHDRPPKNWKALLGKLIADYRHRHAQLKAQAPAAPDIGGKVAEPAGWPDFCIEKAGEPRSYANASPSVKTMFAEWLKGKS